MKTLNRILRAIGRRLGFIANDVRTQFALKYLSGSGMEIGALNRPLKKSPGVITCYVDRLLPEDMAAHYPELKNEILQRPDVIDDAEILAAFRDESMDFVAASHFLEHCFNPIGALENFFRVLRPGGLLYLVVPDKDFTFDSRRGLTTLRHCIDDYHRYSGLNAAGLREERLKEYAHFRDFVKYAGAVADDMLDAEAARLMRLSYSIHTHVWNAESFREFIDGVVDLVGVSFSIIEFSSSGEDCVAVLGKPRGSG